MPKSKKKPLAPDVLDPEQGTESEIFREIQEDEIPAKSESNATDFDSKAVVLDAQPLNLQTVQDYVSSKPVEAALIVATSALVTWVLFGTAPGRKVLSVARERFAPEFYSWAQQTLSAQIS